MKQRTAQHTPSRTDQPLSFSGDLSRSAADVLGGISMLRHAIESALDAHELLLHGIPSRAASHLIGQIPSDPKMIEAALGMSLRTFQRIKSKPSRRLNAEQSGKAWTFASILALATEVFGSRAEALRWLERPAIGLDRMKPIDLIATPAGVKLVETFLHRIDAGVYA